MPTIPLLRTTVLPGLAALVLAGATPAFAVDETLGTGPGADLITLEVNEKPLDIVLGWITRRSGGVNLISNEEDLPKVTMRLVNVTWQEAVDQIARRYDMVIEKRSDRIWELTRPPKVRMQFQDARLTVILEALARQAGVNIVISDRVDSDRRLTMSLEGVPWREALDVIVKSTGYVWIEQDYNIIRVVGEDDVQRDLQTRVFRLNYTDGDSITSIIGAALSTDGNIVHDSRTNSLVVTDTPVNLDAVVAILDELDRRTQEVQIEMKFVEYNTEDALAIGISQNGDVITSASVNSAIADVGNVSSSFFPFSLGYAYDGSSPSANSITSASYTFQALATLATTEIIQTPSILTLNNTQAELNIIERLRWAQVNTTSEEGVTTRELVQADESPLTVGIRIQVTPTITDDGYVIMQLDTADSNATFDTFTLGDDGEDNPISLSLPQETEKQVVTTIMVADGETAVMGGLLSNQIDENIRKVPLLGDIPILGWLFKAREEIITQRNLSIFITPRVVQLTEENELEAAKLRLREQLSGLTLRDTSDFDLDSSLSD